MTDFFLSVIAIVAILCLVVGFAIKQLALTPLKITAVIGAITTLVLALPPLLEAMRPELIPPPAQAPAAPGPQAPAQNAPAPGAAANGGQGQTGSSTAGTTAGQVGR
ncbi:hypothetical protein [Streptomyces sp. NPDC058657]|uniref:hypothetical protein n=1 Tax=unclassified Streptomyces TaxID=2593676 RepID=UPI00365F2780